MAKTQTFSDKSKKGKKDVGVNVKVVKMVKTEKNTFKFSEKFVRLDDVAKVTTIE